MYKWMSKLTGEVVKNFWQVLWVVWIDLWHFRVLNIRWQYNKNGY